MFYLLVGLLACVSGNLDSGVVQETEEESPIHWEECSYRIGEHICNVELTDSNLGEFDLYSHYGRPVVIQLAAEWCGPCHVAGGFAEQFMADWAGEDLLWVTILIENDQGESPNADDLAEWVSDKGITNASVLAGSRALIDGTGENGFPLTSWPTFVVIDRDMVIFHGFSGWSEEYLTQKLTDMQMQGR